MKGYKRERLGFTLVNVDFFPIVNPWKQRLYALAQGRLKKNLQKELARFVAKDIVAPSTVLFGTVEHDESGIDASSCSSLRSQTTGKEASDDRRTYSLAR